MDRVIIEREISILTRTKRNLNVDSNEYMREIERRLSELRRLLENNDEDKFEGSFYTETLKSESF